MELNLAIVLSARSRAGHYSVPSVLQSFWVFGKGPTDMISCTVVLYCRFRTCRGHSATFSHLQITTSVLASCPFSPTYLRLICHNLGKTIPPNLTDHLQIVEVACPVYPVTCPAIGSRLLYERANSKEAYSHLAISNMSPDAANPPSIKLVRRGRNYVATMSPLS